MTDIPRSPARPSPAASILLVRGAPLEVLMVRRGKGAIFSSALVFPGGVVDAHDGGEEWLPYITGARCLGVAERASRIAACRELFEEANVFIGTSPDSPVEGTQRGYFDRVKMTAARIALDTVVPFGHWITPEGVGKRFDTRFYLCRAPINAQVQSDGRETVAAEWVKPQDIITRARSGERSIMFPTLLNLMRLAESANVVSAITAAASRPIFTVVPRIERRADAKFLTIPAEAGYGITEMQFYD